MGRLEQMRIYLRVAETGSLAAAARQMRVDRSLVTRQLASLEAQLGVKLIARNTRRLALTSAGAAYLESCREIVALVDAAENNVLEDRREPRGLIRLSVPLSFGLRHLAPMLVDFSVRYPQVSCEIDFSDHSVDLFEAGLDLAIRIRSRLAPLDVARRIGCSRLTVIAAPDYLQRHGDPQHPGELLGRECLIYLPAQQDGWSFEIAGRCERFAVQGRFRTNNGDVLLEAAIHGLGIAMLPSFISAPAIETGRVRPILSAFPSPELGIYALLPSHRFIPHRVRILIDFLAQRISEQPSWERSE